jgi:hypothetical protein
MGVLWPGDGGLWFGLRFFFFDIDAGHGGLLFHLSAGRILNGASGCAAPFLLGALGV